MRWQLLVVAVVSFLAGGVVTRELVPVSELKSLREDLAAQRELLGSFRPTREVGGRCAVTLSEEESAKWRADLVALARVSLAAPLASVASSAPKAELPQRPAPEADAARTSAGELLQRAISNGTWVDADRQRLHELMTTMTDEQRAATARELSQAINAQKLKLHTSGPAF